MNDKVIEATRWNTFSQVIVKLLSPLTNIILAHILAPEVFGIVASITLVISFIDVFTEAGFQKYIVQHELEKDEKFEDIVNVAFFTNLIMSLLFFIAIIIFKSDITKLIGAPGKEIALIITAIALPLTSFSTIQQAVFQRQLNYKPLFWISFFGTFAPVIITIPLALFGFGFWSIIIGKLCSNLYRAIALTVKSTWKPRWKYEIKYLKRMYRFCGWSMCESIMVWVSSNGDILIASALLSPYYLGIYKTSISTINMILRVVSASILPVTYATLSRFQNDRKRFSDTCYDSQALLASIVLPMGVGIFLFRDLATKIILGSQWGEATYFIGLWSIATSIIISFHYICDDIYRAIGKPKLSFWVHLITFVCTVPIVWIFGQKSFNSLVVSRSGIALIMIVMDMFILKRNSGISLRKFINNSAPIFISCCVMGIVAYCALLYISSIVGQIIIIIISVVIYFATLSHFDNGKRIMNSILKIIKL